MKKTTLLFLILLCAFGCKKNSPTENLLVKIDSLKAKNDSLTKVATADKTKSLFRYESKYDGENLKQKGIVNPEEFIKTSLRKKPELIPLKAVVGGTMDFRNIELLSNEWLIATYDDGHIQGRGLFKYQLNNKGELEFELLNAIGPE